MSGFSFKIGGGHRPRFESFSGGSSSSRSRGRHHDTFDDLSEHFAELDAHFDNMFDDLDSAFSRSGSRHGDRLPPGFRPYAGTSSRGRSGSAFDSDSFGSSFDSDFPGMPDRGRQARYETEERIPSGRGESRPFRMWEAKSGSSSRRRSPSSAFYRESPPRAWAPGRHRSPSPIYTRGYGTGAFDSNATARPFYRSPSPPPRRHRSPSPPPRRRRRRSPSPPPRRRRSPSPLPCRRRSPSPPPRPRHTPGSSKSSRRHRSPSPPRYRAEERRPEGASDRTASSSYSNSSHSRRAPEPAYPGYPNAGRARAQSASHNQYRGDPPKPKQRFRCDPSPPPRREERSKPSSSSRSHSHARSGTSSSSASSSKPTRSRSELKKLFDAYNAKWDALGRTDKNYPLPTSSRDLFKLDFTGGSSANTGNWSNEEIFIANVQVIFLAGFGISSTIGKRSDDLKIQIEGKEANREALKSLAKWLSRKEQPRWHPDRMNLRTGKAGKLDESVSKKSDVVAMRTAGQNLLALVNA